MPRRFASTCATFMPGLYSASEQFLGEVWVNERGQRLLRPLTPRRQWLRGLDLNQRPLGYEWKSALHTDQKEPTGTNSSGDLRGDDIVPCWFVSVGLLHRNFITGSGAPCGFLPGSLRAGRSSIYKIRVPANSDLEVKLRVHERWNRSRFFNTGSIPQRDTPVGLLTLSS